jgi:hypothetical protein
VGEGGEPAGLRGPRRVQDEEAAERAERDEAGVEVEVHGKQ